MDNHLAIKKNPILSNSADYALLRKLGMDYIQQLGSRYWTDLNTHDPGITFLQNLCYAITDLGYRTSLDIKDLLTTSPFETPDPDQQAFYTAREILTTNPWTTRDYRKLLIDIDGVKNAWLRCKKCPCEDIYLYANCAKSILQYEPTEHTIIIKGLYDVTLEFEDGEDGSDPGAGKIKYNFTFLNGTDFAVATIETHLPSWKKAYNVSDMVPRFTDAAGYDIFKKLFNVDSRITAVTTDFISGNKQDNSDIPGSALGSRLRKPVYATVTLKFKPDAVSPEETLTLNDVALSIWFAREEDRRAMPLADLKAALEDASASGIFSKYIANMKRADGIVKKAKQLLHQHRNLCEDFCTVTAIEKEDIGVCTDLEVTPDADIEAVLAEMYFRIDQYFSPDIRFYSLQQLLNEHWPVDEIFDGPKLSNGFIKNDQLDSTQLKRTVYTSDVINLVMEIPGVVSISNFVFTRYDDDGFLVESASWSMDVKEGRQPELYLEASKVLVFKNGLPFLPDNLELADTLQVIKGQNAQPKFSVLDNDLSVPKGKWFDIASYYPVQYGLPRTYGVSPDGLPPTVSEQRKAQAKQLRAYLVFYEQLLINYVNQLAHVKDLFSLSQNVFIDGWDVPIPTYFSGFMETGLIAKIGELYTYDISNAGERDQLELELLELNETEEDRLERRNRFMDHLLSRFAEQFNEYALMLYSFTEDRSLADGILVRNKIAFLKDYPFMSYNKARSFNYKDPPSVCKPDNLAGLALRIRRLLGIYEFASYFELYHEAVGSLFARHWRLIDASGNTLLKSITFFPQTTESAAEKKAKVEVGIVRNVITDPARYSTSNQPMWKVDMLDSANIVVASTGFIFSSQADADAAKITIEADPIVYGTELKTRREFRKNRRTITGTVHFAVSQQVMWSANLTDTAGTIIATTGPIAGSQADAEAQRDVIIEFAKKIFLAEKIFIAEHLLLRPRNLPGSVIPLGDPLLPICIKDCDFCGEEDPYSFRLTVILNGEEGIANKGIAFRRFAEQTIRTEVPAHLGVKICWVSKKQLGEFETLYCDWLSELSKPTPDTLTLSNKLKALIDLFIALKNVYPPATLHDCVDGNDENRVLLNQTIISNINSQP